MFKIDETACTGCGECAVNCPQGAIAITDGAAVIDRRRCIECGTCLLVCPSGAVEEVTGATEKVIAGRRLYAHYRRKEVMKMPRGFGFNRGFGGGFGGRGFGFRGSSPPWPYVGRGRGGLSRCAYPGLNAAPAYSGEWVPPYAGRYPEYGAYVYPPAMGKEEEIEVLHEEANSIKARLDWVEGRLKDLEGAKE